MPLVAKLFASASRIGLTAEQTATLAGVCRQQLYFWRIGRNEPKPARRPQLQSLAEAFAKIEHDPEACKKFCQEPTPARLKRLANRAARSQGSTGNAR